MTENIDDVLVEELKFYPVRDNTLTKELKRISHSRWLRDEYYLYWSSEKRCFYMGEDYKAYLSGMRVEHVVLIPKNIETAQDARDMVKALT